MKEVDREFCKPPLTVQQQIDLLSQRGLDIPDIPKASEYLQFIGYYRLSAYFIPFQKGGINQNLHLFETGATFDRVLDLYIFDRKLRLVVMDAIERIEVAIKATIALNLSVKYGSHWFMDKNLFIPDFSHTEFLDQVKKDINFDRPKKQEKFIQHYYRKYSKPELPPSWMVLEVMTLGSISRLYSSLKLDLQKEIASLFKIDDSILKSWLYSLSCLRNFCAHHSRIWNRTFTIKPKIPKSSTRYISNDRFFAQTFILVKLLRIISPDTHWEDRLENLFTEHPAIDRAMMGFPDNWKALLK